MKKNKIVLKATFVESKNNLFYYKITGTEEWKTVFSNQKKKYISINASGDLLHSVPWYFGKSCNICVNDFSGKLFFDIGEFERYASLVEQLGADLWEKLSDTSGDKNWLTKSKRK